MALISSGGVHLPKCSIDGGYFRLNVFQNPLLPTGSSGHGICDEPIFFIDLFCKSSN